MVKLGYKETEIGAIPEEWEVFDFSKCFSILPNNTYSRAEMDDTGNVMNIHYGDVLVQYGEILDCDKKDIPYLKATYKKIKNHAMLSDGDIVIADTAEDETVGKATEIYNSKSKSIVAGLHTIPCRPDRSFANCWLGYYINSTVFHNQLLPFITGTKVSAIGKNALKCVQILYPPIEEQRKIAEALSNMDELIASLEKLIAKKKAIKQGAMQELLTGKKRLPRFDGEWEEVSFGDAFAFIPNNAFTRSEMADNGKVKNIHYGDILTKFGTYIFAEDPAIPYISETVDISRFSEKNYVQSGDIIMADTAEDETVGKALEVVDVTCPILSGQHTLLCRPKVRFAPKFLGYYLNADCYHSQLLSYIVGTKVSSVSKASVAATKLIAPAYDEQQAIASILSDMDAEIEALEQKLDKCRQTKQGMMQQLLTGKIRLV